MTKLCSLLVACGLLVAGALQAQSGLSGLFVTTTDFSTGSIAFLATGSDVAQTNLLNIHSDAVGHYHDGRIYVVNRLGQDNILVLDPDDLGVPVMQFSVGNGTNPQDIELVAPDKAYVTRYETTDLLIVNPQDGTSLGTIDLSAFADGDGLPEISQMVRLGNRLYLSSQRLDRNNGWVAEESVLIVIDTTSDTVVDADLQRDGIQGIVLGAPNPNSIVALGDQIAVGVVAGFGDRAGGIDLIDVASTRSLGLAVSEVDLGGDINGLAMVNSVQGYAVVTDENFVNSVRPVNLSTGVVDAPLEQLSGGFIPSIAVDGERLLVADRGSFAAPEDAGIKVFNATTGAFIAGPIDTGLPPSSLVVLSDRPVPTAVTERKDHQPQASALDPGYPNPFNATVQIPFTLSGAGSVEVAVFDLLGRRIRSLVSGHWPGGQHSVRWDGRDEQGRMVSNGAYLIRLRQANERAVAKVMLLK